jgi:hypothetical protein
MHEAKEEWGAEGSSVTEVHALQDFNEAQFWLEKIALALGVLYIVVAPWLFLPAARGSLLNTFLGVRYGVAIKWHRCVCPHAAAKGMAHAYVW